MSSPDRRGRARPAVRTELARLGEASSRRAPAIERTLVSTDSADQLQADYFVRLLVQRCQLSDQRIEEYQRAIAVAEAKRDVDAAGGLRRLKRIEEQDRQALDGLVERLCRRFARRAPAEATAGSLRVRSTVRQASPGLG